MALVLFASTITATFAVAERTGDPAEATPARSGSFTTLSYNVAGLPEGISSAPTPRQRAHELISCYVNEFDIVNVQEDYNYHAALYDTCNNHPHRTSTTGGVPFGSGLNTMSRFPFTDLDRVTWKDCDGADECLGNKGFTLKRVRLDEGVYIDVYNVHGGAKDTASAQATRRKQMTQMLGYIAANSAGNSVIIFGDFNTRWTRSEDNMDEFRSRGFKDVWVELIRDGEYPPKGAALSCDKPQFTGRDCEVVDKVLYWDNGYTGLEPVSYELRQDAVLDGSQLSDHPPVVVRWEYNPASDLRLSDTLGGPHGVNFNDASLLPVEPKAQRIALRAGNRVDSVELLLTTGENSRRGGGGGNWRDLWLGSDEHVTGAEVCQGQRNGRTRIFYARFFTNQNRSVEGGRRTSECRTFNAPANWGVVGFHGRAGDEVDRLGLVYAPVRSTSTFRPGNRYVEIRNRNSDRCLEVAGAYMAQGQNVGLWGCIGGAHQRWYYDDHTGLIRNQQDVNYCLDNSSVFTSGANAIIWPCNGNPGQRFTYRDGVIRMRTMPNQVLDAFLHADNVGTWEFNGGPQQRWTYDGADLAPIDLVSEHSRNCLDTSWGTGNGTLIYQWTCWGGAPQSLRLAPQGDAAANRFQIVGNHSGKCVSVPGDPYGGATTKRGAQLHLWDCRAPGQAGSRNQVFEIRSANPTGNRNQIVHSATGLCLDLWGSSIDNGASINLWDCHGGANQMWKTRTL